MVARAIDELRLGLPQNRVTVLEEPQGGAYVIVDGLDIGPRLAPSTSWIGFAILFQYPLTDVYPHFLRPDLTRADGSALTPPPLNPGQTMPGFNRPAVMLSRRSNRWDPQRDSALKKLLRILAWLRGEA